jgi:FdhE protein
MIMTDTALDRLKRQRPEWEPWLAVVELTLREAADPAWDDSVPAVGDGLPLLDGAMLSLPARGARRLLEVLVRAASRRGTEKMATLQSVIAKDLDVLALFRASVCQEVDAINALASASGADAEAFQAVAALLPVPFLQACHRRWSASLPESWIDGHCPLCASWPAFAEVRGIERSRHFRCGRCGGQWHARALWCPYCTMHDHDALVSLVPDKAGAHAAIEACTRCRGYVKTFTTLQGCAPGAVMVEDLASVDLDVAAIEQGYSRPPGSGRPLAITIEEKAARRRFFEWKA